MTTPPDRVLTGPYGCALALLIGFATVASAIVLTGANLDLEQEWGILLFQVILVATPFGVLATDRENGRPAWLTAIALTAIFWSLLVGDALARRGAGGANIGLAFLMVLSPLIITGGALAAGRFARRR